MRLTEILAIFYLFSGCSNRRVPAVARWWPGCD